MVLASLAGGVGFGMKPFNNEGSYETNLHLSRTL